MIRLKENIYPSFLNYYLQFFYKSGEIVNYQAGSNNLRNLKFPDYLKIEFPLPPKPIQQAIVSKIEELFSELDKSIKTLRLAQQQLKTYRQAVLKCAFEGKLTEEWRKENGTKVRVSAGTQKQIQVGVLSRLLSESIAAEPLLDYQNASNISDVNELPEGWSEVKVKDVAKTYGGYAFKSGDFQDKESSKY